MSCTIGAGAPSIGVPVSPPVAAPAMPAMPIVPTGAVDGAVAGTSGGAVSSLGGGGTAVAGAAAAIGPDTLVPLLQQLVTSLNQLISVLSPVSGGGGGGCPCQQSPGQISQSPMPGSSPSPSPAPSPAPPSTPPPPPAGADIGKWVTGDKEGLNPDLLQRLAKIGERMGEPVSITSGHRSREEQEVLYQKYLNGTGNLAAKPGTSNHESGNAADVKIGGTSLANNAEAKKIADELGLHFPVPGEPWHIEIK